MSEQTKRRAQHHNHHHNGRKKRHTVLYTFLIIILVLIVGGGAYAYKMYHDVQNTANKVYKKESGTNHQRSPQTTLDAKKPISILLLGTDTGALGRTYHGRSDTMIVATVNPQNKQLTMVSIPRDTKAHIVGKGANYIEKINSAYSYGGSAMAINTTQELLNIPIDYYVTVNMGGIQRIVNAVGGVTIDAPFAFKYDGNSFKKGSQHLNGKQALAYSRMRYDDPEGDYGRQKRQRQVIESIVKSAVSVKTLWNFDDILQSMSDNVQTDLTFKNMQTIQKNYKSAATNMVDDHLQGQNATIDGGSYQVATTKELNRISSLIRTQLNLPKEKVNNLETQQNSQGQATDAGSNNADPYTN
ncbi:hypothetical protein AYR54_01570 [Loigolactobacillus backii]|uniref:LCP family glycopolymer transferase n=1 Tax=Loigolactobacillus backii TaxID=375175 RepID=UPI0007F09439|nr:LCP family protein [Loigolactobacillus backii]ANK59070.1 hypothetical protein AYR52_01580 [Loigolactobacillus backii]ANK64059.1 hypothetical protein AYR54_01570 [Loigolactobacillus backii]ANK67547.1 hypothetical protein AYR55_07470 [Loigolactobacillus backii]OLF69353.1 hypothetical protein ACX53_08400 [Loigolactobacillus backii]